MLTEIQKKTLLLYVVSIDEYRRDHVSLIAAKTFYEQGEYAWAIQEIKEAMKIPMKLRVELRSDLATPAHILIPKSLPIHQLQNWTYLMRVRNDIKVDFETFVTIIAHELSHVLLHWKKNKFRHSEKATDVASIFSGFGHYIRTARASEWNGTYGYLSDDEFNFVYDIFFNNKKFRIKSRSGESVKDSERKKKSQIDHFLEKIKRIFK